ncbi:MAG: DUF58 domain-containing protein [Chloroflexota bacterium]
MSLAQRRRAVTRAAAHWLGSFASSVRSVARQPRPEVAPLSIPWSTFDRLQFVVSQRHRTSVGGEHRGRQRAPSPDFADYRPYQHGDDVRRIDWNVYGRLGVLQLRQTEAQLRVSVKILLDCSASMHWGEPEKFKFARELTLALSRVALARSDSVSITCLGHADRSIGPLSGIHQFGVVEHFLNATSPRGKVDLVSAVPPAIMDRSRPRNGPGLTFLISDLHGITDPGVLFGSLRSASESAVTLHVVSQAEADPEALGDVDLVDAESGQIVEVGLSLNVIQAYRARYDAWRQHLERTCGERDVRYVRCSTERTIPEVVLADLRNCQVVR